MANQEVAESKPSQVSEFFEKPRGYLRETMGELRKVHWPTWPEARMLTGVVLGVMLAVALFLGLFDFGFEALMLRVLNLEIVPIAILTVLALAVIVLVSAADPIGNSARL
jgi:preprotein translocase subunit SecE